MYIITVIPITKSAGAEELTYYTPKRVARGALVRVPVRKKLVPAIVADIADATQAKSELRTAGFMAKKIESVIAGHFFTPAFIAAASRLADYFATTTGAVINALTPSAVFELPHISRHRVLEIYKHKNSVQFIQKPDAERITRYRDEIKKCFARKQSSLVIAPTIQEAEGIFVHLSESIEAQSLLIHSGLTKRQLRERWQQATTFPQSILVIGTASILSLPRPDIGLIILEHESSRHHKHISRPFLDTRVAAQMLAEELGAVIVLGDRMLSCETLHELHETSNLEAELPSEVNATKCEIIDMRPKEKADGETEAFKIFSDELRGALAKTIQNGSRAFLFATRKGLAPQTVCRDCGNVVSCSRCSAPMVVHSDIKCPTSFVCHHCGLTRDTLTTCDTCGSWRLEMLGIGSERVVGEVKKLFPDVSVFELNRDAAPTHTKAKKIIQAWQEHAGGVLIGTEMALPYAAEAGGAQLAAIVSADSLFALPDFRMNERIFRIVSDLRLLAKETCIIQTRHPETAVLAFAIQGDAKGFCKHELEERKRFNYPPFSFLIKVTRSGMRDAGERDLRHLQNQLSDYKTLLYPGFIKRVRNKYIMNLLITIPTKSWPDPALLRILRALPPSYKVECDPHSVL